MSNYFFSYLQFPNQNPFHKLEYKVIQEITNDLNLELINIDFDINNENSNLKTYNYYNIQEKYNNFFNKYKKDLFIIHKLKSKKYISFDYSICNILNYYPENTFLSFEEIKGLNSIDKIICPTKQIEQILIENHINKSKIKFIPIPLFENTNNIQKINEVFFDINSNTDIFFFVDKNVNNKFLFNILKQFSIKFHNLKLHIFVEEPQLLSNINENMKIKVFVNKLKFPLNYQIKKPILIINLSDNITSYLNSLLFVSQSIPVITNKGNYDSCFFEFNDTIDLLKITENIFENKLSKEIIEKYYYVNSTYSTFTFKNYLSELINKHSKKYIDKINDLKKYPEEVLNNEHSKKIISDILSQIKKLYSTNNFNITELTNSSKTILNSNIISLKEFLTDELKGECIIINQILENLETNEIKSLIKNISKKFDFILIISKSENFPNNSYRSKEELFNIINEFNIIKNTYFGNPDLKILEKEFFLIIIQNNKMPLPYFITWEGSQFFYNSLSTINRELELKLIENNNYELSIIPKDYYEEVSFENYDFYEKLKSKFNRILLGKTDFYIRHILPSNFQSPEEGYYILIFPWEFGYLPSEIVNHINKKVDQIWCPSNYVKQLHINSGVLENKIKVIPNGINTKIYNPNIKPFKLKTSKKFKFLFLGGIIYRKGIDILLEAYEEEFTNNEDVTLVIKGLGQNTYYREDFIVKKIKNFQKDISKPEIEFIENNFSINDMGKIYTACDCYVHPYRGEGFCMPLAEAMACGIPVITTNYGPSKDFCNDNNSYLIDYKLITKNIEEENNQIIISEADKNHLKKLMRDAFNNREEVKQKGKNAHKYISQNFSWNNIFQKIEKCFYELRKNPIYRENFHNRIKELESILEYKLNELSINEIKNHIIELEALTDKYSLLIGKSYIHLKEYKKSIDYLTTFLKINPNSKEAINLLITSLEELGDTKTSEILKRKVYDL